MQDLPGWLRNDPALYSGCVAGAISEEQYVQGLRDAGMDDVQVTDRITYDTSQLCQFVSCELPACGQGETCGCGCGASDPELAARIAGEMTGKIWSAHFEARKP